MYIHNPLSFKNTYFHIEQTNWVIKAKSIKNCASIASMSVMTQIDGLFPKFLSLARLQVNRG